MAFSALPADAPRDAAFSFFFLPLFFFLWLFVGCTREELQKLRFSQILTDLANKTSPFCWY
jgi:hypothetical protein